MDSVALEVSSNTQIAQSGNRRKESGVNFEAFCRNWADYIEQEQLKLRKLTEMSVTLHRRFRGLTTSDMVSRYGVRQETNGVWVEYDPDLDGEIHPINIVQPAIRANTNACLQSNAQINIESANAAAKNKKIADRWQKVSDYFEKRHWSEQDRTILFDALQKDGTALIRTVICKGENQTVPQITSKKDRLAEFNCVDCGEQGRQPMTDYEGEDGESEFECPFCQGNAYGKISSMDGYALGEANVNEINIKQELVTFYNFCIDSYGAKKKGIDSAKWIQIHELKDRPEIENKYPQFNFGSPNRYSYQLQCDYALASQDWAKLNGMWIGFTNHPDFERFEERRIYLHEEAYQNYICPEDYQFVNGEGNVVFNIKRGEKIAEAQERLYGENQHGICFVWMDDQLRDIVSPKDEILNFREQFKEVHWLRDSSGFYSSPNYSIVIIQDDITLLNTMNHNIMAQNATIPVYYDSLTFEESDFTKQFIGTKNNALMGDKGIEGHVTNLPVPQPSPYLQNQLQFLWQVKDSVTMVQPAMRGEMQKGETYGAQRQQLEQSFGNLTSPLKSFAQAKVGATIQKFGICKKFWTVEQFQSVASQFGEVWTDDDVREMCEADFEKDLLIDYLQGSEMPSSNFTKELQFFQGLSQLLPFVQANPELVGTDKIQKLLSKIDEYADFDFDVTGLETMEILAQKRVLEVQNLCQQFGKVSLEQVDQAKQQIVGMDEMQQPITQFDLFIEQIFAESTIRFNKHEDLQVQAKFFIEQLQIESGKDKPNWVLIEVYNLLLTMLEEATLAMQQEAMMKSPEYQMQMQQQQEQIAREKETADAERQHSKETAEAEREANREDSDREFGKKLIEKGVDLAAQSEQAEAKNENGM